LIEIKAKALRSLRHLRSSAGLPLRGRDCDLDDGAARPWRAYGENKMKTVQAMLAEAEAEVPRISPDEAKGLLGRADVLFLDVREPAEVATSGKVPGALAVPRGLVEFRADPASAMHDAAFDRAKTVIAYCASGGRSALVGKTLKEMGYSNVRNLGGFKGWLEAGGDVEKA
jgi:rhodanese-related sulfurtransferase